METLIAPDCVAVCIIYLQSALAVGGDSVTHVGSRLSTDNREVVVTLVDSFIRDLVIQTSTVRVDCWVDETLGQENAQDLGQLTRGLLGAMQGTVQAGATVYKVADSQGIVGLADVPDPISGKARYSFHVAISMRRVATLDPSLEIDLPDWFHGAQGPAGPTGPAGTQPSRIVQIQVSDPNGAPLTVGVGKAYFRVNAALDGWMLTAIAALVTSPSSSGAPSVQITNVTQAAALLTTELTIDQGETDSSTAAVPAVVSAIPVAGADELRLDVTAAGIGTLGLLVEMTFTP